MGIRRKRPKKNTVALERIEILFREAQEEFGIHPELSRTYVERARRIAMRDRIRIPRELRRKYCRKCFAYLVPGINARVRIHRGKIIITCLECGNQWRHPVVRNYRK
ncbi:ribonuclease P [Methanomicrobiaceae archaeon CYW5]|uniref:ribonuclease P protein component 4 n=1 Tax=Methanovulcanius yangii TaxID=1789227 RepID=UPI0029CA7B8D|nr:ribonuclease P protein component 4 [Methanovulcanius yangii]MBT8507134.1 ribonuclease P [Methanovulcanius yangii]